MPNVVTQVQRWIDHCRAFIKTVGKIPYIDDCECLDDELSQPPNENDSEVIEHWRGQFECSLQREPTDMALRFASLYAARQGGLWNPYLGCDKKDSVEWFKYLAGLGMPERLSTPPELKFELHCLYLAANWEKAEAVLARIEQLKLMPAGELRLLCGQFWFLSVFGRRMEYELDHRDDCMYDFEWWLDLPRSFIATGARRPSAGRMFSHPELLRCGSEAAWVLAAFCMNPRAPRPILIPPEAPAYLRTNENGSQQSQSPPPTDLSGYFHDRYRDFIPISPPLLCEQEKQRLQRAMVYLEQGAYSVPLLAPPYLPLLARSYFSLEQFEDAAKVYRDMGDRSVVFVEHTPLTDVEAERLRSSELDPEALGELTESLTNSFQDFEWERWFCSAWCCRLQGNLRLAVEQLIEYRDQRNIEREPVSSEERLVERGCNPPGVAWWIAKWLSEEGSYDEAAVYLREEAEGPYSPPESWQLSTILALGSIVQAESTSPTEAVRRYFANNPSQQKLLHGVVNGMWSTFSSLEEDCQLQWLAAVFHESGDCPLSDAQHIWLKISITEYASVIEQTLRTLVFDPFRDAVHSDASRKRRAKIDCEGDFYRLLFGSGKIELGKMVQLIEECGASTLQTEIDFADFVRIEFPRLLIQKQAMRRVTELRNSAVHTKVRFSPSEAGEMSRLCRAILDAIYIGNSSD